MWVLLVLVLLFGLLLWLPIEVEIDTEKQIYVARWRGIFGVYVLPEEEGWNWFFRLFGWKINRKTGAAKPANKPAPKKKTPAAKRSPSFFLQRMPALFRDLLRAIRIGRLHVNWDTGDFVLNAWLYPAFRRASCGKRQLFINFSGQQELAILLYTRLGLLAVAAVRVLITLKK